jgi:hypothetical protein
MATSAPKAPRASPSTATLLAGLGLAAALVAFLAGQWTAGHAAQPGATPGAGPAAAGATAAPRTRAPATVAPWTPRPAEAGAQATAIPPAPAPTTSPGRATPALVARATAETTAFLESSRSELGARCWPRSGLASGAESTLVTFNVTFDASGREIARGIGEDRRARAPELVRCLQRMPLGSLRISPPGANVGVRVAMRLP